MKLEKDFKLIIDDPSGNSHIENPHLPAAGMYIVLKNNIALCVSYGRINGLL